MELTTEEQIREALKQGKIIECNGEFTEGCWRNSIVNDGDTTQADFNKYKYRIKPN